MLSALGVINGYTDGSFKPDATITRAEAAKMIYTIWNGGNDDASAFEWKSVFNDVYSGHWAEGYINFCYTNGIINGTSATTFAPEESVTGTQLAKMLLICMGYQADKSGLEGTGYSQRTNALATQNGLYVDVAASVSNAMPRQYAAQIMYNALKADTVKWSTDIGAYEKVKTTGYIWMDGKNGQNGSWVPSEVNETMGKKCMGLDTREDVMLRSVEKESGRDTYSLNGGEFTRVATDYSDLIGQYVNVMIKDDDTSKVYGVYADEDSSVVASGVVGQLEKDDDQIKLNGTSYDVDNDDLGDVDVYYVNSDTKTIALEGKGGLFENALDADYAAWDIKLLDTDGDGDVDSATVQPTVVKKVTYVNNDGIRVDGISGSLDFADHNIYEGVAKDDWAVIKDKAYTVDGEYAITKADVVSGRVGSVHKDNSVTTEVRVDGTWYKSAMANDDTAIGANVDLVVYGGVYFDVDGSTASLDVAVVTGVGNWDNMDDVREVRLMFKDGSEEVVDVEHWYNAEGKNDKNLSSDNSGKDTMVAYDVDDGKYTLYSIENDKAIVIGNNNTDHDGVVITTGSWSYDDDRAIIKTGNGNYDIADSAMVVIKNSSDDYVYMTGADLLNRNSITFTTDKVDGYLAVNEDGEVVALFGKTTSTISSGATNYGYIVDVSEAENADEDVKMYIDVITEDGLLEDVETDEDSTNGWSTGMIISYTMDGDVMAIDKVAASNIHTDAIRSYTDSRVRFYAGDADATGNSYSITSDTAIIAIEKSGTTDADFAGTSLDEALSATHKNAAYILDGSDIEVIFVEVEYNTNFVVKN